MKALAFVIDNANVAIKGGGHTAWAGAANVENGALLSMRKFRGVSVNEQTGIVSIGAGERWEEVYSALEHQGLAVTGGRVAKVGVGGLILGCRFQLLASSTNQYSLMSFKAAFLTSPSSTGSSPMGSLTSRSFCPPEP